MTQQATQPVQQLASQPRQDTVAPSGGFVASVRTVAFALLVDRALSA